MPLEELIAAMSNPAFYPQAAARVELRQTHISCVFLAGDFVYKIKKPLQLAFLDYSTLERRYHFCQEEVRLNRRLTQRVYLGVFPIGRRGNALALGEQPAAHFDPEAVEYAVKMRRLPQQRSLERLVGNGEVDAATMRRIAGVLAKFHAGAARDHSMVYGSAGAVALSVVTNIDECRPFVGDTIGERDFNSIRDLQHAYIGCHRGFLDNRARTGMVREGHGDLRSEHICVTGDIDVIDCVEFSEKLRYADIASDLAFLLMDLDRLRAPTLAHHLLSAYVSEIGDRELSRLLDFYKCHRAMVRGKVGSLKASESEVPLEQRRRARESARDYFAAAARYAKAGAPALIVVCGLPGSGKSTVAQALAERSGFAVFNSDVTRKQLAGKAPTERAGCAVDEGIYSREFTAATYRALAGEAAKALLGGDGVIIDATYKDRADRIAIRDVARNAGAPIVFAQCAISDAQARQRLDERAQRPNAVSDATFEIYLQHKANFAPFDAAFAGCHLRLDGAAEPALSACEIERFLADHR